MMKTLIILHRDGDSCEGICFALKGVSLLTEGCAQLEKERNGLTSLLGGTSRPCIP